ncbi:ATP-binding protein [Streptomyces sp. G45]|uniref:ATP-binding protein n=1 Tax=Streptomyces sp. G45 TaxID=3406627 RepID=UPI003C1E38DE
MSLPLTRRIARAALLVAAGAAPVVGAAGSASAVELPASPHTAGVTAVDAAELGGAVDGATRHVSGLAGEAGGKAMTKAVPAVGKAAGKSVRTGAPVAQQAADDVAGSAGKVLDDAQGGLPSGELGKGLSTDQLPVKDLPVG